MTKDNYVRYGIPIAAGAIFAVWVGLPPALLLFLVICPLMTLLMMRGMYGGGGGRNEHRAPPEAGQPGIDAAKEPAFARGTARRDHTNVSTFPDPVRPLGALRFRRR